MYSIEKSNVPIFLLLKLLLCSRDRGQLWPWQLPLCKTSLRSRDRWQLCKTGLRSVFPQCHCSSKPFFMDIRRNDSTSSSPYNTSDRTGKLFLVFTWTMLFWYFHSVHSIVWIIFDSTLCSDMFSIWMMYGMFLSVRVICGLGLEQ